MKSLFTVAAIVFSLSALVIADAEAARVGGGKTMGRQSQNVQRDATPQSAPGQGATQATPSQAQPAAARQNPAAAPQAQPPRNRWLAPLAGLAAGLGLAALASHLGFGEGLASIMLVMLLAFAAVVVVRMIMARRAQPQPALATGYGNTGIGSEATVRYQPPAPADAQVRQPAPVVGSAQFADAAAQPTWRIPADFDVEGFVRNAKVQFVRLQAAFDAADLNDLREFTSPQMFAELKMQIEDRKGTANRTDVVSVDAQLLGIESTDAEHVASVRFRGLIRESDGAPAQDFDEVWNLTKPVAGSSGWVLGGIQQLN